MRACPAPVVFGSVSVTVPPDEGCWLSVVRWITAMGFEMITGGGAGAAAMATLKLRVALALLESITVTVAANVPAAVGVPLMVPPALIERPLGSALADQV